MIYTEKGMKQNLSFFLSRPSAKMLWQGQPSQLFSFPTFSSTLSVDSQFSLQKALLFESQISALIQFFPNNFGWVSGPYNLRIKKLQSKIPKEGEKKLKLPISYRYSFQGTISQRKTTLQTIKPWQFHLTRSSALTLTLPLIAEKGLVRAVKWSSTC